MSRDTEQREPPCEPPREAEIAELAQQIERYVAAHPRAADTLGGILCWWLARQRYEESADKVLRATEYLVAAGKVAKQVGADGTVIYTAPGADRSVQQEVEES